MRKHIKSLMTFVPMLILSALVFSCNGNNGRTQTENIEKSDNLYSSILSVDNKKVYLGEIDKKATTVIPFTFNLKNETDSIIVIDKVDVSCSCVKISGFPKQLEAGQSGNLTGEVNLKNQSGHLRKSIFVNYCDTCITALKIVADIMD